MALGVDVANSESGDRAAIARFQGSCLLEVSSFACPDALKLGIQVHAEMGQEADPRMVGVDSGGVGAACVNKLRELGLPVRALNGAERAGSTFDRETRAAGGHRVVEEERFANLRAQM